MPDRSAEQEAWPGVFSSHATLTYSADDECRTLLTGFVRRAVAAGHRVVIFLDTASAELARALAAAASGAAPGQFSVLRFDTGHTGARLPAGGVTAASGGSSSGGSSSAGSSSGGGSTFGGPLFGVADMLSTLAGLAEGTFAAGYQAISVAGDMVWTQRAGYTPADLVGYEHRVNRFFGDPRVTGLCLYDRRQFGTELLGRLSAGHPGPLLRFTLGGWGAHLRLIGELDASNAGSLPSILDLVGTADSVVMLDASELTFVDAAGAGIIVRFAASRPNRHTVVRCRRAVRQALQLVGAESVPSLVLRDQVVGV
ncbi:MEDS domain-containing protein [Dactylosporangium sp. CA-092794]|uniref:MEDS domain-containing protein n=1 Tax=Dactylosporangium sp. CA-092794 TaxID=3239929 RepID=UPI003D9032C1